MMDLAITMAEAFGEGLARGFGQGVGLLIAAAIGLVLYRSTKKVFA